MFAALFNNLWVRMQLLYTRIQEGWNWIVGQLRAVQLYAILIVVNTIICGILTNWYESHAPAAIGMVITYILYLMSVRRVVVPILLFEIGVTLADRVVGTVDSWWDQLRSRAPWPFHLMLRRPDTAAHHRAATLTGAPHGEGTDPVWHDVSVAGHIFHVMSTITLWSEVFLYACGILPVWHAMLAVVVTTIMILLFVATEDFVDIKKWRRRLGYVVTIQALTLLGPLALRAVAPGTYQYVLAIYDHGQAIDTQVGADIDQRIADDQKWIAQYDIEEKELLSQRRANRLDPANYVWTPQHEADLERIQEARADVKVELEELKSAATETTEKWTAKFMNWPQEHPGWLIILGLLGLAAARSKSGPSGH